MLLRYAEATRTAAEVARRAVTSAGARMRAAGTYVLNPGARRSHRSDRGDRAPAPDDTASGPSLVQVLEEFPAQQLLHRTGAADAPIVVAREVLMEQPQTEAVRLVERSDVLEAHLLPDPGGSDARTGRCAGRTGPAVRR